MGNFFFVREKATDLALDPCQQKLQLLAWCTQVMDVHLMVT